MSLEREDITKEIIGAAFEVHNALGYGFLEKVYQNAMIVELKLRGIDATAEKLIQVYF
jgi:GxxExxY protein